LRIVVDEARGQAGRMVQRHQRRRADAGAEIEHGAVMAPHRGAEQHGIEPGTEPFARLCDHQSTAEKGIARRRLVFYNIVVVV
jgi:hypothetical protein